MSMFVSHADEAIAKLQAVKSDDQRLQDRIQQSVDSLQNAHPDPEANSEFRKSLAAIHDFIVAWRQKR